MFGMQTNLSTKLIHVTFRVESTSRISLNNGIPTSAPIRRIRRFKLLQAAGLRARNSNVRILLRHQKSRSSLAIRAPRNKGRETFGLLRSRAEDIDTEDCAVSHGDWDVLVPHDGAAQRQTVFSSPTIRQEHALVWLVLGPHVGKVAPCWLEWDIEAFDVSGRHCKCNGDWVLVVAKY